MFNLVKEKKSKAKTHCAKSLARANESLPAAVSNSLVKPYPCKTTY